MRTSILILVLVVFAAIFSSFSQQTTPKSNVIANSERLSLDKGWLFHLGDIPKGNFNHRAGDADGAAASFYDDSNWHRLNLPHDWAVESEFNSKGSRNDGYRSNGIGWYRRYFKVDPAEHGKNFELQLDGMATFATIWVNGTLVQRNWCGYTSCYIDITPLLKYGDELNIIAVRVDADATEGWWYEGAGIYRHTWLVKRSALHIETDGVFANPIKTESGSWIIPAEISLANSGESNASAEVEITLTDHLGKTIAQTKTQLSVNSMDNNIVAKLSLPVSEPKLWSPENPVLYQLKTTVKQEGINCDEMITPCGFRTIRFDANLGLILNDKPLKIKGVCNHQDFAGVGVAVPKSIWDFELRKLKEMGSNGFRCAHNPPAAEFLDACDRIGILVMNENREFNTSAEYLRQLQWMVRRDRNHPSVILWSVFNEEPLQGTEVGYEMVRRLSAEVKKLDKTRPVTAAMNGGQFTPMNVSQAVDVVGFNYSTYEYDRFHKTFPNKPMTSSEDGSGLSMRGEYKTDAGKNLLDNYDLQKTRWGNTQRENWKLVDERPFLAGTFIWTAFDYRGEPTPYQWPTVTSNFGLMDLCGFPKVGYYIRQAQWVKDKPVLQIVPHWTWPSDSIGKPIRVLVASNAESVKLLLNGKLISEKPVDKYEMITWFVPYKPGKLEAIAYTKGKIIARKIVETTMVPVSVQLIPDRPSINGDGWDAMPVTVQVLDTKGRPVPTANLPIEFEINGSATIIGLGNGNPNSHEPEKGNTRLLYNGLAQVIIQSVEGATAPVLLTAKSSGLKPSTLSIEISPKPAHPFVETVKSFLILEKWRSSPFYNTRPDPNQTIAETDVNTWTPFKPGQLQNFSQGRFAIYRTIFTPFAGIQKNGGTLVLKSVTGKAEVWIDGVLASSKSEFKNSDLAVPIPSGKEKMTINVLVESDQVVNAGLGGIVSAIEKEIQ